MEQDLQDINEQILEKVEAKSKKKRESNDRMSQATIVYHSEMFLSQGYLRGFCAMKNLLFQEPEHDLGYSIDDFKIHLYYACKSHSQLFLPICLRLISDLNFKKMKELMAEEPSNQS